MNSQIILITALVGFSCVALVTALGAWVLFTPNRKNEQQRPQFWRSLSWLIAPVELSLIRFLPHSLRARVQGLIANAGLARDLDANALLSGCIVAGALGCVIAIIIAKLLGISVVNAGLIGLMAATLPLMWMRDTGKQREQAILRQLPFVLDLITLAVESGLNLTGAIVETVEKGPAGILRDELATVLRDIRAGARRAEALESMGARIKLPAVTNLVAGLIAADRQGGAIGVLLRGQALQRRNERFARAEKLAMEAPVKMLFPLIAFIFPCTFIILFFPIFHRLVAEGWLR